MTIAADVLGAPDSGATPLLAGRIQGIRAWSLIVDGDSGRDLLGAFARDVVWPRARPMRAVCVPGGRVEEHPAPQPDCTCGIYSHHPFRPSALMTECSDDDTRVLGVVDAWGRVEVHEHGFRAEYARPAALIADAEGDQHDRDRIKRLAADYGAEYLELDMPEEVECYCAELEGGLARDAVDDLLFRDREVVVHADAQGYLTRRGRAIGGYGYAFEEQQGTSPWHHEVYTEASGVQVLRVAGAAYRPGALLGPEFSPGRTLRLLAEPTNLQDRNAISIWDELLQRRVGYIPRSEAPEVGRRLAAGRIGRVMSLWERRDLESGERFGLHILISRTPRIRLAGPIEPDTIYGDIPF